MPVEGAVSVARGHFLIAVGCADQDPPDLAGAAWIEGSYPCPLGNEQGKVTDLAWRRALERPRVIGALHEGRFWTPVATDPTTWTSDLTPVGVEYLALPQPGESHALSRGSFDLRALLLVHLTTGVDPLRPVLGGVSPPAAALPVSHVLQQWKGLIARRYGKSTAITQWLSGLGARVDGQALPTRAAFLAFTDAQPDGGPTVGPMGEAAPWLDQITWQLARGTFTNRSVRYSEGSSFASPNKWSVVDRDGFAVCSTLPDRKGRGADTVRDFVPIFHSIYADVLLLGTMQGLLIEGLLDGLGGLGDPVDHENEVRILRDESRRLRNQVWWETFSDLHWPDAHLAAFQRQNQLHERFQAVRQDLDDFAADIERAGQRRLEESQRRTNVALAVVALAGLVLAAFGISGATATWLGLTGRSDFWWQVIAWNAVPLLAALAVAGWAWRSMRR